MKSLICITTCNRLPEVKKFIWDYISFCNKNIDFDFLLALDGDNQEYVSFCQEFQIPLLYSTEREGVGLSKNRVLKRFPDYDFYFFIEDDVELINDKIFSLFIEVYNFSKYSHLSCSEGTEKIGQEIIGGKTIDWYCFGGGYFNFFSKSGIKEVGGWNTGFAKYKRFGHTEHSYRFFKKGLTPAPFCIIQEGLNMIILHNPPHVSNVLGKTFINGLLEEEMEFIKNEVSYFAIQTLSPYFLKNERMDFFRTVEKFLKENKKKYPLTFGLEKRKALADHYFLRIQKTRNHLIKFKFFIYSMFYYPLNNPFKHYLKTKIIKNRNE